MAKEKPVIRKPYDAHDRVKYTSNLPSRTKQSFADESNINTILRKYHQTGFFPYYDKPQLYGDFTNIHDYHTAHNKLIEANNAFNALPSNIRKRFENSPAQFLEFIAEPSNHDEMVELGLAIAKPKPDPAPKPEPAPAGD